MTTPSFAYRVGITVFMLISLTPTVGSGAGLTARAQQEQIDQRALFNVVGAMYGLDPELLAAVAEVESGGRSNAVSRKGAIGLMQLMPATAARYRVNDPRDPIDNTLGAARYLAHLKDATAPTSDATPDLARILAAYNAGEGAVSRYDGIPPYAETREYVARVLWMYLLGVAPPPHARPTQSAALRVRPSRSPDHGDREVLEQLNDLRQARDSAVRGSSQGPLPTADVR